MGKRNDLEDIVGEVKRIPDNTKQEIVEALTDYCMIQLPEPDYEEKYYTAQAIIDICLEDLQGNSLVEEEIFGGRYLTAENLEKLTRSLYKNKYLSERDFQLAAINTSTIAKNIGRENIWYYILQAQVRLDNSKKIGIDRKEELGIARDLLSKAQEISDDPNITYNQAMVELEDDNPKKTIELLTGMEKLNLIKESEFSRSILLGDAYRKLKDFDNMTKEYMKILEEAFDEELFSYIKRAKENDDTFVTLVEDLQRKHPYEIILTKILKEHYKNNSQSMIFKKVSADHRTAGYLEFWNNPTSSKLNTREKIFFDDLKRQNTLESRLMNGWPKDNDKRRFWTYLVQDQIIVEVTLDKFNISTYENQPKNDPAKWELTQEGSFVIREVGGTNIYFKPTIKKITSIFENYKNLRPCFLAENDAALGFLIVEYFKPFVEKTFYAGEQKKMLLEQPLTTKRN